MPLYNANAIVLHRTSFGETDRIVRLYTRERGKISCIAKGARKPLSRLAGATEVVTYGKFQFATGRNLDIITQVEVKESFPRIHSDLLRTAHSMYIAELMDKLVEEHEPSPNIFDLLLSSFFLMERPNDPEKIANMFELQFMKTQGYEPTLDRCIRCSSLVLDDDISFSPALGGTVCRECGYLPEDAIPISRETIAAMTTLLTITANAVERLEIPKETTEQISRIMRWYIRYRSDRDLKSADFLQRLRTNEPQK